MLNVTTSALASSPPKVVKYETTLSPPPKGWAPTAIHAQSRTVERTWITGFANGVVRDSVPLLPRQDGDHFAQGLAPTGLLALRRICGQRHAAPDHVANALHHARIHADRSDERNSERISGLVM